MTHVVVVGAGPAGLMAAETIARQGFAVTVCDAMPSPARKFLMAGKSGLNLTFKGDFSKVMSGYVEGAAELEQALRAFGNLEIVDWAETLGSKLFVGSTGRVFPKVMKASPLLRAWLARLDQMNVQLRTRTTCSGFDGALPILNGVPEPCDAVVLACGGASWPRLGSTGDWAAWIGPQMVPFSGSNVGVHVPWSSHMAAHFGKAIKAVSWKAGSRSSRGEATLVASGLEGGGIYALTPALRDGASLTVDLLPDVKTDEIAARFLTRQKKMPLSRWLEKGLRLQPVKRALFLEATQGAPSLNGADIAALIKAVPIAVSALGPIEQAISTAGGVPFSALDDQFMLRDRPGVFCAGEMLDWDALTGGWLLTASLATGAWAGQSVLAYLNR